MDLLLENPVKLPFLGVELPLKAFFFLAPILFLIIHAYMLVNLVILAAKIGVFQEELIEQFPDVRGDAPAIRERLRRQLPSNILVQFLAGPADVRKGGLGMISQTIAWITIVVGSVFLLLLIMVQFLPDIDPSSCDTCRCAATWALWPTVLACRVTSEIRHFGVTGQPLIPLGIAFTAATFPGERLDDWIGERQWIRPIPSRPGWGKKIQGKRHDVIS